MSDVSNCKAIAKTSKINPWHSDTIVLDDFKTALDRLKQYNMHKIGGALDENSPVDSVTVDQNQHKKFEFPPNGKSTHLSNLEPNGQLKGSDDGEIDLESALRMDSTQLRKFGEMEKG